MKGLNFKHLWMSKKSTAISISLVIPRHRFHSLIWVRKASRISLSKMTLEKKVKATIQQDQMLSPGDGVLVAVSGGPDSVALLYLLFRLREELSLRLEVAHLQHGIRGEEAQKDALFVANMAKTLELPFHIRDVDLPRMRAERGSGNLEAMARDERHRFFIAVAQERGLHRVATAHTRDDQVETIIMWLLRGSGRKGLGGMPPVQQFIPKEELVRGGPMLIRPLIETSRKEIIDYVAAAGLEYRIDRTNLDPGPQRNWIRLHLLPQLRERMGPRLDERLAHLADLLCDEEEILECVAKERLQQVLRGGELVRERLLQEPKAMRRRIVRLWLESHLGDLRAIDFDHVEKTLQFVDRGPPQASLSIPKGWTLIKQYEAVRLERGGRRRKRVCYSYEIPAEGELVIPEAGMKILSSRSSISLGARPRDDLEALFDLASLPGTLKVRSFRNGDRFQPLGMRGHKKVKDLFIERKVPLVVRANLPLLLAGDEILWVPRFGRSEVAKIRPETREVLRVRLVVCEG